ncbi:DUF2512 family protein [Tumebacillus permanentifrigoris]|uniref:Uncharacterized protein DUF2512 n=1 Tax=Tumebacillus permanentifrigoris TaxID=378543 RepID=A0A316DB89_9BACL|nr:DUF2512 family protein [Tumebacillus permanentifrigoris]PWK13970.1 uncharacterized protein DUF2512 [Tumebacillus permanentifrigoris]
MNQALGLIVKLIGTFAAVYFVALFFPLHGYMNIFHALILSIVITLIGFVTDLVVPTALNNIVAIAVDFVMAAVVVKLGSNLFLNMYVNLYFALFVGLTVALVEFFYHAKFVRKAKM